MYKFQIVVVVTVFVIALTSIHCDESSKPEQHPSPYWPTNSVDGTGLAGRKSHAPKESAKRYCSRHDLKARNSSNLGQLRPWSDPRSTGAGRPTGCRRESFRHLWCCKRKRRQSTSLNGSRRRQIRLSRTKSRRHEPRYKRHKSIPDETLGHKMTTSLSAAITGLIVNGHPNPGPEYRREEESNFSSTDARARNGQRRKSDILPVASASTTAAAATAVVANVTPSSFLMTAVVRPIDSLRSRTFKISLGQVIPQRQKKPSRQGRRRQDAARPSRVQQEGRVVSSANDSTSVLFEGVSGAKNDELTTLMLDEDFETALMEFVEMAYRDETRARLDGVSSEPKSATKASKKTSQSSGAAETAKDFRDETDSESTRCGLRLNYDASKLFDLAGYFKNQLAKTTVLANSLTGFLFDRRVDGSDHFLGAGGSKRLIRLLESLLADDPKMVAATLSFDPSQKPPRGGGGTGGGGGVGGGGGEGGGGSISPYVVKTRRSSAASASWPPWSEGDHFVHYDVSDLSRDRYALGGSKGFEWFWKLRGDYSHLLWRHTERCLQQQKQQQQQRNSSSSSFYSDSYPRFDLSPGNETYWGPVQSDCLLRRPNKTGRLGGRSGGRDGSRSADPFAVWTIPYSVPIFGCGRMESPAFLGVLKVDLDLSGVEFDQCTQNRSRWLLFHLTHNCPQHTQCQHIPGGGFRRGSYRCLCSPVASTWTEDFSSNEDLIFTPTTTTSTSSSSSSSSSSTSSSSSSSSSSSNGGHDDNDDYELPSVANVTSLSANDSAPIRGASIQADGCYLNGRHLERCYLDQFFNLSTTSTASGSYNVCRECLVFLDENGCPDSMAYDHRRSQQLLDDYNYWMRGLPLGIQCFTILTGFTIAVVVARLKKNRVMINSVWILLEFTILGAIILHFSVILAYLECTPTNCIVIVWFREIGFLLVYGSLLLKLHRTLSEFQSRKAHRVQWRDLDLVRCLLSMLVVLTFTLASWTAAAIDGVEAVEDLLSVVRIEPRKIVALSYSLFSTMHGVCRLSIKDRLLEAGELLFLAYSAYMCYKVRKAPTDYFENRYITFCVLNETLVSVIFYSFRYFSNTVLHPDYMFLAFFVRCHVTASATITLVVCSKLWYSCWPPRETPALDRARSYSTAPSVEPRTGQAAANLDSSSPKPSSPPVQSEPAKGGAGSWDLAEFDIANSSADDIRYELRKLYTQLQIYKTKAMRQDNPHISKRRGGKKQTTRKFSFQTLHSKYKQQSSFSSSSHAPTTAAATPSGSGGYGGSLAGDQLAGDNSTFGLAAGASAAAAAAATASAVGGGGEAELSVRSPEDSSNSMEGVSVYMDESSYAAPEATAGSAAAAAAATSGDGCAGKKKHRTLKSILSAARSKAKRRGS